MIKILKTSEVNTEDILKRESAAADEADRVAAEVIENVKQNGDKALP